MVKLKQMIVREGINPEGMDSSEGKDTPWDTLKTAKEEQSSNPDSTAQYEPKSLEASEGTAEEEDLLAPPTEEDEMDLDAVEEPEEIAPPPMEELDPGEELTGEELEKERLRGESGRQISKYESVIKGELRRLRKAVEAYEAHVFKGTPLSVVDMATIARIGGERVIRKQLELTLAHLNICLMRWNIQ